MTYNIDVTAQDIKAAAEGDRCPVELAVDRALGISDTLVTPHRICPGANANWRLPTKAQTFVRRYDKGKPVEPFSFRLEPRT